MQSAEAAAPLGDRHDDRRSGRSTHDVAGRRHHRPATSDPITAAEPVIASVARELGYRELGLTSGTLDGRPAEQWEFMAVESGVLLHKEDVFFASRSGTGTAVLTPLRPTPTRACPNASRRCAGRSQHTHTDDAAHSRASRGLPTIQPTQRTRGSRDPLRRPPSQAWRTR